MRENVKNYVLILAIANYWIWLSASVASNFIASRQVPKFSLNNCAQSSKKTFMCPKFCTNPILKYVIFPPICKVL